MSKPEGTEIERLARAAGCTDLQIWTLAELAKGRTPAQIAEERGVLERGVWVTRAAAFRKIQGAPSHATNRQRQAIELRDQGHSWRHIGRLMGIDHMAASRLVERGRRHTV